jgi:hypothetical protein
MTCAVRRGTAGLRSKSMVAVGTAMLGLLGCSSGGGQTAGAGGSAPAGGTSGSAGSAGAASVGTGGTSASGAGGVGPGGGPGAGTGGVSVSGAGGSANSGGGAATGGGGSGGTAAGAAGSGAGGAGATGSTGLGGAPSGGAGATGAGGSPFVDLFNGTDLTGFNVYKANTTANNSPGTLLTGADAQAIFQPENGMIHVYGDLPDQSQQVHYLMQTATSYANFNVTWDYKWGTKKFALDATGKGLDLTQYPRDAGLVWYIHGDKTQVWPSSIEFQNKWGSTGDIFALYAECKSLGVPGNLTQFEEAASGGVPTTVIGGLTQHMRSGNFEMPGVGPNASTGVGSDWNTCLLQVNAGTASYTVNGHIVNRTLGVMNSAGTPVTSGYMAWQAEQAEVYYRNLRIQVLP